MAKQERGLGKGLSALLGNSNEDIAEFRRPVGYINKSVASNDKVREGEIVLVPIGDIVPNPYQPRVTFDETLLQELAVSIRTLGLIQPITVRRTDNGKYQIISGERRFRASKLAGLTSIPAYLRTTDDSGMLELAIVENVQRADLDPIETAMSYKRLIDECRLTQEQMADRIGKGRVAVTNTLRLLRLPAKVQYDVKVGNISVGHAKVLLGLEDPMIQESLSDRIIREGLSVRALEAIVRKGSMGGKRQITISVDPPVTGGYNELQACLGQYCSGQISVRRSSSGKGSITLRFSNDDEVDALIKALRK